MDIFQTDRELCALERDIKLLAYLKPTNLTLEKKLFFSGKRRNPVFTYRSLRFDENKLRNRLRSFETDRTPTGFLLKKKIEEETTKLDLLAHRGKPEFLNISEKLYGAATGELEKDAAAVLKNPHAYSGPHRHFSTSEVQEKLESVLASYGLANWRVRQKSELVSDIAAGKRNALFVREGIVFTEQRMARIIAHEIETHILTAENGKHQPLRLFERGFANYLETQEGLAIYAQECQTTCRELAAHRVSYLTLAVCEAARGSFRDVFEKMRAYGLSEEKSFRMAMRAKRGICDTAEKGAFTKDLLYLKGYRRIEAFAKEGGDLKKLYVGKIALEDLPFINKIPGIVPPKHLPRWLEEKNII